MITKFTTKVNSNPGPIDINKKNMISRSLEMGRPLFYSENIDYHYKTKAGSIDKGLYDDYISFCILKTNDNRPFYSISLDVKGENARKRLKAFVDSTLFDLICNAIAIKIIKNIESGKKKK